MSAWTVLSPLRRLRQHRWRWWERLVLVLLVLFFVGLGLLPFLVRREIVAALAKATPATVRLADVDLNLLHGQLVLKGLSFTLPGEEHAVIVVDNIVGQPHFWSLLHGEKKLAKVLLSGVRVALIREPDGRVNLTKLFPPAPPHSAPETDLPTLTVEQFRLEEVNIECRDLTRKPETFVSLSLYEITTGDINLQAKGLAAPVQVQMKGQLNTKERLVGSFASEVRLLWRRSEMMVDVAMNAEQLALALVEPYLGPSFAVRQLTGKVDGRVRYHWQHGGEQPPAHVLSGAVTVADLAMADQLSEQPALQMKQSQIVVDSVDLQSRHIRIASVKMSEPRLRIVQTPAGLNWTTLVRTPNTAEPPVEKTPSESAAWRMTIENIETQGGELHYHNSAWTDDEAVTLALEETRLQHVDSTGTASPFRFRVRDGDSLAAGEGTVHFSPLHLDARVQLTEVSLSSFQPLLVRAGRVKSAQGKLNGTIHTVLAMQDGTPTVNVDGILEAPAFVLTGLPAPENTILWDTGHIEVREGSTVLPLQMDLTAQFAKVTVQNLPQGEVSIGKVDAAMQLQWKGAAEPSAPPSDETPTSEPAPVALALRGEFDLESFLLSQGPEKQELVSCYHTKGRITEGSRLAPLDLHLADVALEYPYVQGFRTASGHIQITKPTGETPPLANTEEKTEAAAADSTPKEVAHPVFLPVIHVDQIVLIGGQLYVEDHAITPVQTIYWQDIRVDVSDAAYPLVRPTAFALHAYNMDGSLIEASGTTKNQNDQLVTTIRGTVDRLKLPRFNAYLAPLLGYQVRKGAISVKWEIAMPGDFVQATAAVTLHDLGLSGKQSTSEVEQQVGLSMSLIIALLKDLNGDINLNLPVEGRLNESGFHMGGSLWQTIRDVLVGAITSPLKLLGAIFRKSDSLGDFVLDPIRFVPGTNQLSLAGKEQVNRLRVFLTQRPELDLQMNSTPSAADRQALHDQLVLAQLQRNTPPPTEPPTGEQAVSPEEEVKQFLLSSINQRLTEKEVGQSKLSPQATTLLESLRKTIPVDTVELEQLAQNRLQIVTMALTENAGVRSDRLRSASAKLRGRSGPEVQYMIQAREEKKK